MESPRLSLAMECGGACQANIKVGCTPNRKNNCHKTKHPNHSKNVLRKSRAFKVRKTKEEIEFNIIY